MGTIQNDSTYVNVIEDAFGAEVDFAQLRKVYRAPMENETRYSPAKCIGCSTPCFSSLREKPLLRRV